MSVEATDWALTAPIGGNPKIVLLGLASHASPDGSDAYPSLDRLAVYAHCNRVTVHRSLKKLEAVGLIVRDGKSRHGTVRWTLAMDPQIASVEESQSANGGVAECEREELQIANGGVAAVQYEPSLTTDGSTSEPSTATEEQQPLSLLPSGSSNGAGRACAPAQSRAREAEPKKVDDQLVSAEEHDAARRVLDAFNAAFDTRFAAPDWRAKIIRRLREHADLDVAAHEAAITQNAQNPWWTGAASPSVIYGSAEQFERSLHVEPRKRGRGFKHEQNVPSFDERVRRRNEQREREAAAK